MKKIEILKNRSLAFEIWIVFACVILGIFIMLSILFSFTLKRFFTNQMYDTIEIAQKHIMERPNSNKPPEPDVFQNADARAVSHIIYPLESENRWRKVTRDNLEWEILWKKVINEAQKQQNVSMRYQEKVGNSYIFYIITKLDENSTDSNVNFIFSFMWDTYRNNLIKSLEKKLIISTIIAVLISLVASIVLSRFLTKPIRELEDVIKKIARRDWDNPVKIKRSDEIGNLSESVEYMRKELVKWDESQQWMLQNVSHELKTPVMVIRSYAQSVGDGIFPKGDLTSTMDVIDSEAERLEKKIKDLLYFSKLEYMSKHKSPVEDIHLDELIESISGKFISSSPKLKWNMNLENVVYVGDREQWTVVFENIFDNAMRYAKESIDICLWKRETDILVQVHNDGEHIEDKTFEKLFTAYEKGKKGNYGLGLAIVKQIVEINKGSIFATNDEIGVTFHINISEDLKNNASC